MTQTEKRLVDFAQLVKDSVSLKPSISKLILTQKTEEEADKILKEFSKKEKTDGRKKKKPPVEKSSSGGGSPVGDHDHGP